MSQRAFQCFHVSAKVQVYIATYFSPLIRYSKMKFDLKLFIMTAPYYLLVVPYAVVQLFLHVTEQFLRGADLFLSLLLVGLSPTVLF
jgi:hypothetical protein